jgi:hypothetical protein
VPRSRIALLVDGLARDFERFAEHGVVRVPFTRDDAPGLHEVRLEAADRAGNRTVWSGTVTLGGKPEKGGKPGKAEKSEKPRKPEKPGKDKKPGQGKRPR